MRTPDRRSLERCIAFPNPFNSSFRAPAPRPLMLFEALGPMSIAVPAVDRGDFGLLASRAITIGSEAATFTDFLWEAFLAYGIIGSGHRIDHFAKFVKFDKYSNLMRSGVGKAAL